MKNYKQEGEIQTLTCPATGVVSGDVYQVGQVIAIATVTVTAAEYTAGQTTFEGLIRGVVEVDKVASQAWAVGDPVYYDTSTAEFTKTAPDNRLAGWATKAVGSGATEETGEIYLDGAVRLNEAS